MLIGNQSSSMFYFTYDYSSQTKLKCNLPANQFFEKLHILLLMCNVFLFAIKTIIQHQYTLQLCFSTICIMLFLQRNDKDLSKRGEVNAAHHFYKCLCLS